MLKYFFLLAIIFASGTTQGCGPYSKFTSHTMCIYKEFTCPGYQLISRGLTTEQKNEIVSIHNKLRQSLVNGKVQGQPKASWMATMVYDEELSIIAQRTADQCRFEHDIMRDVERFRVGQNIYQGSFKPIPQNKGANMTEATLAWWDEVINPGFNPNNINPYKLSPGAGHYTQIAWAKTWAIGCGYSMFSDRQGWAHKLLFCNYGPSGNVLNTPMYIKA